MILEKHFLLPINAICKQFEDRHSTVRKIMHKCKHSKQLPIFPELNVPANSPQGQTEQRSEKNPGATGLN